MRNFYITASLICFITAIIILVISVAHDTGRPKFLKKFTATFMRWLSSLLDGLFFFGIIAIFVAVVGGIMYFKYSVYKERYPQAAPWTFFFQSK